MLKNYEITSISLKVSFNRNLAFWILTGLMVICLGYLFIQCKCIEQFLSTGVFDVVVRRAASMDPTARCVAVTRRGREFELCRPRGADFSRLSRFFCWDVESLTARVGPDRQGRSPPPIWSIQCRWGRKTSTKTKNKQTLTKIIIIVIIILPWSDKTHFSQNQGFEIIAI